MRAVDTSAFVVAAWRDFGRGMERMIDRLGFETVLSTAAAAGRVARAYSKGERVSIRRR